MDMDMDRPTDQRHHPHSRGRGRGIAKIHETEESGSMRWCGGGGAMLLLSLERGGGKKIRRVPRKEIIPGRRLRRPCQVAGDGESSPHQTLTLRRRRWGGGGHFRGIFPHNLFDAEVHVPGVHAAPLSPQVRQRGLKGFSNGRQGCARAEVGEDALSSCCH